MVGLVLAMIRFPHTLFALPFAIIGCFLAARSVGDVWPGWWKLGWILAAMVGARSAAMAANRIIDLRFDRRNPRTKVWALPSGTRSGGFAGGLAAAGAALLALAAGMLNTLCLVLSPIALAIIIGYSWMKRVTALSHFVLGLSLGIAPVGAWLAVTGSFLDADGNVPLAPLALAAAVILWVAGFDLIYACQDYEFDRSEPGLKSIPKSVGIAGALWLSALLHVGFLAVLVIFPQVSPVPLGVFYWIGVGVTAAALIVEHAMVRPGDLSRANAAFFAANGIVSLVLAAAVLVEVFRVG